jgi:RNA polymerase sigma-70 factor (ECF subfamily)
MVLPHFSDEQLVRAFQEKKDMTAIELLYRRYYRNVFFYCYRITGNREDALDASSEVFRKVIEHLELLQHAMTFQVWLFRIARNQSIKTYQRRHKYTTVPIEDVSQHAQQEVSTEAHWEKDRQIADHEAAVAALPADSRTLLKKKYRDGETIESLMQQYHLSKSAVKMRLARARQQARKQLGVISSTTVAQSN